MCIIHVCLILKNSIYDPNLRLNIRNKLGIENNIKAFLYSGGIVSGWHLAERMFTFFNEIIIHEKEVFFLILTKDKAVVEKMIEKFPSLKQRLASFSVDNSEVNTYLNAADYGILFRENTIMNNVASPSKFAEYMLSGLPVIISEGVGDYSTYTKEKNVGIILKEAELWNPNCFDFGSFFNKNFDRVQIAELGKSFFSKQAILSVLSELFKA